ncbi:MAG: hypothetical protein EBT92_01795 [Planctomycetes bacterium]|nr:hypothetical protein [Planctomycetota bacterium]NBY03690.1 hypothetical protein [Planctomycetota bacterium]NDE00120.1 hypothetical protein [bacterium]
MGSYHPKIHEIIKKDPRFPYEAYEFLFQALAYTQKMLGKIKPPEGAEPAKEHHVSGKQLIEGIRKFALDEFGLMARCVFNLWGIKKTGDFGSMVFNLVEIGLMSKTDNDSINDFKDVFDIETGLMHDYVIAFKPENERAR